MLTVQGRDFFFKCFIKIANNNFITRTSYQTTEKLENLLTYKSSFPKRKQISVDLF